MTNIVNKLNLRQAEFSDAYIKELNINRSNKYCHLYLDGKKINDTLYRLGGMFSTKNSSSYFLILKYEEAIYPDNITKIKANKRHLAGKWVIIDTDGNEVKVFEDSINSPYIVGEILYSFQSELFNIKTGKSYGKSYKTLSSNDHIIFEPGYESKYPNACMVMINKQTGEITIID